MHLKVHRDVQQRLGWIVNLRADEFCFALRGLQVPNADAGSVISNLPHTAAQAQHWQQQRCN